jgi:hypothetical protein
MKTLRLFFLLTLASAHLSVSYASDYFLKKDLQPEWQVYQEDQYIPYAAGSGIISSIHFQIDARSERNDYLAISSKKPVSVFLNGKILATSTAFVLKIDSLAKLAGGSSALSFSVHGENITPLSLQTSMRTVTKPVSADDDLYLRTTAFRDFAIFSFVIILVFLIVIVQLNPKLAADYFSITKIFSLRETEDSQAYTRITSSTNFLFYIFCSLMLGYYFMIVFHFVPERYSIAFSFQSKTFAGAILQWLRLSSIILLACVAKIALVYTLTFLFGVKELAGIHFFNWMRLILIFFGAITLVVSFYFIAHGQQLEFFSTLLKLLSWVLLGWMILIGLKLSRHMGRSLFHLFSYICATELIPFLITLKVLYN